ncbi:UNKNOWN [Stylonychia lemnae]|uniref:B box-type domain-containing protein n=1 Tax=Stylonychia lemnae TaxID=5949 RepID=A0A078AEX9_STYLE|nr:UNKNOWN [Stylonychia lemnae]|eukprot:CDW80824.1 UNKNOWN [Stylonychia lemnae]
MYCESCSQPLCKQCTAKHHGLDHNKFFLKDYLKTYPTKLQEKSMECKKLLNKYQQYKIYEIRSFLKQFQSTVNSYVTQVTREILKSVMFKDIFKGYHTLKHTPKWFDSTRVTIKTSQEKYIALRMRPEIDQKIKEVDEAIKKLKKIENQRVDHTIQMNKSMSQVKQNLKDSILRIIADTKIPQILKEKDTFANFEQMNVDNLPETQNMIVENEINFPSHSAPIKDITVTGMDTFMTADSHGIINEWNINQQKLSEIDLNLNPDEDDVELLCFGHSMSHKVLLGGLSGGELLVQNQDNNQSIIGKCTQSDIISMINLKEFKKGKYMLIQDKINEIKLIDTKKIAFKDQTVSQAITYKFDQSYSSLDNYESNKRLLEIDRFRKLPNLKTADGTMNYTYSTVVLSSLTSIHKINMIKLIYRKNTQSSCFSSKTWKNWNHQVLQTFDFTHGPTCFLELSGCRLAVGVGANIEIFQMDEANNSQALAKDKKAAVQNNQPQNKKLILKGHIKRVRSLAIDTTLQIDHSKVKEEFIVSCSDDGTVRVWQIPEVLDQKLFKKQTRQDQAEEIKQNRNYFDEDDKRSRRSRGGGQTQRTQDNTYRHQYTDRNYDNDESELLDSRDKDDEDLDDEYDEEGEDQSEYYSENDKSNRKKRGDDDESQQSQQFFEGGEEEKDKTRQKLNQMTKATEDEEEYDSPNCCIEINTLHKEKMTGVISINSSIITVSKDAEIKLFKIKKI